MWCQASSTAKPRRSSITQATARQKEQRARGAQRARRVDARFLIGATEDVLLALKAAEERLLNLPHSSGKAASGYREAVFEAVLPRAALSPEALYLNLHDQGSYSPELSHVSISPPPQSHGRWSGSELAAAWRAAGGRITYGAPPMVRVRADEFNGVAPLLLHAGRNSRLLDQLCNMLPHMVTPVILATEEDQRPAMSEAPRHANMAVRAGTRPEMAVGIGHVIGAGAVFLPETLKSLLELRLRPKMTCASLSFVLERGPRLAHAAAALRHVFPDATFPPDVANALREASAQGTLLEDDLRLLDGTDDLNVKKAGDVDRSASLAAAFDPNHGNTSRRTPLLQATLWRGFKPPLPARTVRSACPIPTIALCTGYSACRLDSLLYALRGQPRVTHAFLSTDRVHWGSHALNDLALQDMDVAVAALRDGWRRRGFANVWLNVLGDGRDGCFDRWPECRAWVDGAIEASHARHSGSVDVSGCRTSPKASWLRRTCPVACGLCPKPGAQGDAGRSELRLPAHLRSPHRLPGFSNAAGGGTVFTPVRTATGSQGLLLTRKAASAGLRGLLAKVLGPKEAADWWRHELHLAAGGLPPVSVVTQGVARPEGLTAAMYFEVLLCVNARSRGFGVWAHRSYALGRLVSSFLSPREAKRPAAVPSARWEAEGVAMSHRALQHRSHPELYLFEANPDLWLARYLHPQYDATRQLHPVQPGCWDVFQFPLLSTRACEQLISEAEAFGKWSGATHTDQRLQGGYENVPTQDIHMWQLGLRTTWLAILRRLVGPVVEMEFDGYQVKARHTLDFVVKYTPTTQAALRPHHDSSMFSVNVALNGDGAFQGGGTRFIRQNCSLVRGGNRRWEGCPELLLAQCSIS
jgi:hypothetical protein